MGKRVLRFALLGLLMVFTAHMNAQTFLEGFESGIPSSWKQVPATGVTAWTVGTSGLSGVSAYEGNNYVSLYTEQAQVSTKLILPMVFIGGMSRPELSFYLVKQARSAAQGYARDTLRVWYRTTAGGTWQPLQTFSEDVSGWTREAVNLEGRTIDSIQLSMEFVFGGGRGIGLDLLSVGTALVCTTPTNLRAFAVSSTGASLTWDAHAQTQWANIRRTFPLMMKTMCPHAGQ